MVADFSRLLLEIESCYANNCRGQIGDVMRRHLTRATMPAMVDSMLSTPEVGAFLSKYSYAHQNGFDKLMLYISPAFGWKARLHIWWNKEAETPEKFDIHNHAWDYHSYVVLGSLTQHLFEHADNAETRFAHYHYSIDNETLLSELRYKGEAGIRQMSSGTVRQGEVYGLQHEALHQIFPVEEISATLFIHDRPFKSVTDVYKQERIPDLRFSAGEQGKMSLETAVERMRRLQLCCR